MIFSVFLAVRASLIFLLWDDFFSNLWLESTKYLNGSQEAMIHDKKI